MQQKDTRRLASGTVINATSAGNTGNSNGTTDPSHEPLDLTDGGHSGVHHNINIKEFSPDRGKPRCLEYVPTVLRDRIAIEPSSGRSLMF